MDTTALEGFTRGKSALNFNYLMNLYEVNYTLFTNLIDNIEKPINDPFLLESISIKYELISSSNPVFFPKIPLNLKKINPAIIARSIISMYSKL